MSSPLKPFLTVVTIVRNDSQGLELTSISVAQQTDRDFEWIVVDGASSDGTIQTLEKLRGVADMIVSEPDAGIYDAMNKGLRLARGQFILFMNAGDQFASPHAVGSLHRAWSENPGAQLIYGASLMQFENGRIVHRRARPMAPYIEHGLPALHQAFAVDTALHQSWPYRLDLPVSADYGLVAQLHALGAKHSRIEDLISTNYIGGQSFSHRHADRQNQDVLLVQRDILRLPPHKIWISQLRRKLSRLAIRIVNLAPRSALRAT